LVALALLAGVVSTPTYAEESSNEPIVIEPAPGREVVGRLDTSFCKGIKPYEREKSRARDRVKRAIDAAQSWGFENKASTLITDLCTYPDDPAFREQLRYVVQLVVNQTGRSTKGAIESLVARADPGQWRIKKERGCTALEEREESEDHTGLDNVLYLAKTSAVGCSRGRFSIPEVRQHVDQAGDSASELVRVENALNCLPRNPLPPERASEYSSSQRALVGQCGPYVKALDRAKLDKETAKMTVPLQVMARENLAKAKAVLSDLERSADGKAK